jgi:hypothetical protein
MVLKRHNRFIALKRMVVIVKRKNCKIADFLIKGQNRSIDSFLESIAVALIDSIIYYFH